MGGLQFSIPQRLFFIRIIVTIGLIISFFLSVNLWGGQRFFPSIPVFEQFFLKPPFDYALMVLSILFLIGSTIFYHTRSFIFLALLTNCFLVLFDLNRLQPWFYIYNAVLFIFLFYNGRVDNPDKFTAVFVFIQLIVASVYVYNGISQLRNPNFISTDFYDVILPLKKIMSERQFNFFIGAGKITPFILIFVGVGMLIQPVKYLAISLGLTLHLILFILLFPSAHNSNFALWFMNLVFGGIIVFLFSGKTRQSYFNHLVLFQKPLFYIVVFAFWIMPGMNSKQYWPDALSFNFKSGISAEENILISEPEYANLPFYVKGFCSKNNGAYLLQVKSWCSHELRSEYFDQSVFAGKNLQNQLGLSVPYTFEQDELSLR